MKQKRQCGERKESKEERRKTEEMKERGGEKLYLIPLFKIN